MLTRVIEFFLVLLVSLVRRLATRCLRARPKASPLLEGSRVLGRTVPSVPGQEAREVRLPYQERRRHVYVLGATGSGKTNLLLQLVDSDIRERLTFCVIDLRGDLVDRVLARLSASGDPAEVGRRLLLFDLREQDPIVGFNPLAGAGEPYHRALHLLSVLRSQADSWGVQLEETLRNALMALAEAGLTLLELDPLLSDTRFRERVLRQVSDSAVRSFFRRYRELSSERQMAWKLPVLNKVTPLLAIPQLRLVLGQQDTFSFERLLDGEPGRIILVALALDRLQETALLVGGLLLSSLETAVMARAGRPEAERAPAMLYVDEFESFVNERFERILAEGRRFGLGLTLAHQNLAQLDSRLRSVLRNNAHTQVYFQTGSTDAAELAGEAVMPGSKEEIRTLLMSQAVGEALLLRRGQETVRVRFHDSPDPNLDPQALKRLRDVSLSAFGRSRGEVEQELQERERLWLPPDDGEERSENAYEIRQREKPREFKPRPKKPL